MDDGRDFGADRAKHTPKPYPNASFGTDTADFADHVGKTAADTNPINAMERHATERRHARPRAHVLPTLFRP